MNSNMMQLKVAVDAWCDQYLEGNRPDNYETIWEDKFAEVLVQEVIDVMVSQMWNHGIDQSNNPAFYKAIDKTKQHFGVE